MRADGRGSAGKDKSELPNQAMLASWATPRAADAESAGMRHGRGTADTLSAQAGQDTAGWPTPMAGTPAQKGYNEAGNTDSGRRTTELASGPMSAGTPAETESSVRFLLNPRFSLWLQGLPAVWASCGERATRSSRRSRKSSSKPTSTSGEAA